MTGTSWATTTCAARPHAWPQTSSSTGRRSAGGPRRAPRGPRFAARECAPGARGGNCTLCDPNQQALDYGVGTQVCSTNGRWECKEVKRNTIFIKAADPWLSHRCGSAAGDYWDLRLTPLDMDCE